MKNNKNKLRFLPLITSEKPNKDKWDKTKVVVRTQDEINIYKKAIGYRKARIKRYGQVPAKKAR